MSENIIDPLNINIAVGNIDTTLPVLPEQDLILQVAESTVAPNKDQTGRNWVLKFATTTPLTATDGRPVAPNYPIFQQIALQAKADSTDPEAFKRQIAQTIDALFGTDKTNRPDLSMTVIQDAVGKQVNAHVKPEEYQEVWSTKIKRIKALNA